MVQYILTCQGAGRGLEKGPGVGGWSLLQSGGGIWAPTTAWFLSQEGGGVLGPPPFLLLEL